VKAENGYVLGISLRLLVKTAFDNPELHAAEILVLAMSLGRDIGMLYDRVPM